MSGTTSNYDPFKCHEQLYYIYDAGHRWGPPDVVHHCAYPSGQTREIPAQFRWPLKNAAEISQQIFELKTRNWYQREYQRVAGERQDARGAIDAAVGVAQTEAQIRALRWALGEIEKP